MNFFDLCAACGRAIGRGCAAFGRLLAHMLRLTYRYWWIVLTLVLLAVAGACYYTRTANQIYRVNAIAWLNGPAIQQFEQTFAPLRASRFLPEEAAITSFIKDNKACGFATFRVIDCLHDGEPDYVDFKGKSSPTDTVRVQMKDRLCLQFRIKERDKECIPAIEKALLAFLNSNEVMQRSYEAYLANLREEVLFNHRQALKLDSLTTHYYFYSPSGMEPNAYVGTGVNFYGDRRIRLFLDEIYEQHEQIQKDDYRMLLATAPVVLENHFAVDAKPVNGRSKMIVLFFLLAWIGGCALAELIDKRKALSAWLKA